MSLFPELITPYFEQSILKRAAQQRLFSFDCVNPRDFSTDKWRKTDDTISGGGAGMVMTPQPLFDALGAIRQKSPNAKIVFLTPAAKRFCANDARRFAQFDHLVLVCGRYEGIDERVIETFADEVMSIGDFVLTGGELAALVIADSTLRFVPQVLGNSESLSEESYENSLLEAPSFTKPAVFRGLTTPQTLLGGNHKAITAFKQRLAASKTNFHRPDIFKPC